MPSSRPSAPRPSAATALDCHRCAGGVAEPLLHRVAMRCQLRRLAHDRAVDVADRETGGAYKFGRYGATSAASRHPSTADRCRGSAGQYRQGRRRPSNASITAWATASASLWPCKPRAPSKTTPPRTSGRAASSLNRWMSKPCPTRDVTALRFDHQPAGVPNADRWGR